MSGCQAQLCGQDETYACGRPVLFSSTRCDRHIDGTIELLEEMNVELRDSIAAKQMWLQKNEEELAALRRAVAERDSPNS